MLFYQINVELEALNNKYDELETVVKDNYRVCEETTEAEENLNHRIYVLEQEVACLKDQNNDLREHYNKVVNELNCIITMLNEKYTVEN